MEMKDLWEKLGKPSIVLENPDKAGFDEESILNFNQGKISSLVQSIEEIEEMIKQRGVVSKKVNDEADKIKLKMENLLLSSALQDSDSVKEKLTFRQKQMEISEMQLTEIVNCWRDIAQLKKELRENQRELNEKQIRIEMLNKLLED